MGAIVDVDVDRLAKLCGLFGSDHLGERAAAAAKAHELVRGAGLTWPQVFGRPSIVAPPRQSETSWRHDLSPGVLLATYGAALTGWEKNFLATLVKRPTWSAKQRHVLDGIRARFK